MSLLHLAIRIRSGNEDDTSMGHVEVNLGKKWQKLKSRNWTMDDAKVVCREAGYKETLEYINAINYRRRKERYPEIFPDSKMESYQWNKKCTGDEYSILRCNPHSDTSGTNDDPTVGVGVGVRCKIPGEIKHHIVYFYFNFIPEKFFVSACDMLFTPH